jgi:tryptophan-rich sensory protein
MSNILLPRQQGESPTERSIRMALLVLLTLAPSLIFVASLFFPTGPSAGECVPFRPASWVYGVVWTILVLLLSIYGARLARSNVLTKNQLYVQSFLTILTVAVAISWMWRYPIDKREGVTVFVFLAGVLSLLVPLSMESEINNGVLLMPLTIWVLFQTVVNAYETTCPL